MAHTAINTVKAGGEYYFPGDTIPDKALSEDDVKSLLASGVIKDFDPGHKAKYEEAKKPPPDYENDLTEIKGIGHDIAGTLNGLGIRSFNDLSKADPDRIAILPGVSRKKAKEFISEARKKVK